MQIGLNGATGTHYERDEAPLDEDRALGPKRGDMVLMLPENLVRDVRAVEPDLPYHDDDLNQKGQREVSEENESN